MILQIIAIAGLMAGLIMLLVSFLNSRSSVDDKHETVSDIDPYFRKKRRESNSCELFDLRIRVTNLEDKVRDEVLDALPIRTKRREFLEFKGYINSLREDMGHVSHVYKTLIDEVNALKKNVINLSREEKK